MLSKRFRITIANLAFLAVLATAVVFVLSLYPGTAVASTGINQELSFEGKITSSTGTNITDGNYNVEFQIWNGASCNPSTGSGCTAVWTEDYLTSNGTYGTTVPVAFTSGTFQVNLGSICSLGGGSCEGNSNSAVNFNSYPLYVSINVGTTSVCSAGFSSCGGGTGVMYPLIALTSSPYSFNSNELGGIASTGYIQTNPTSSQTIQPTTNVSSLIVEQNNSGSFANDVFDVQGSSGSADDFLQVTSTAANAGAVTVQSLGSNTLSLQSGGGINIDTNNVANTLQIGNTANAVAQTIDIGNNTTASSTDTLNLGSLVGTSATTIQAGTGNISLGTGNVSGTSGSINIATGNSATGTPGNISADTGTGILTGSTTLDDNFEGSGSGSVDDMNNWYSTTLSASNAEAHGGSYSLKILESSNDWGVTENSSAFSVTAGQQYEFTYWLRAGTVGEAISSYIEWWGCAQQQTTLNTVTDNSSGWTEVTGEGVAPTGCTGGQLDITSTSGVNNQIQYLDDFVVTNLSTVTAPSIKIGATNTEVLTLGNDNEAGATSLIGGGGGINITADTGAAINVGSNTGGTVAVRGYSSGAFELQNSDGESVLQAGTISSNNYITDGDFANGSGSTLNDWTKVGSPTTYTQNTTSANTYEGATSLQLGYATGGSSQGVETPGAGAGLTSSPTTNNGADEYYTVSFEAMEGTGGSAFPASDFTVTGIDSSGNQTCTGTVNGVGSTNISTSGFEQVYCTLQFTSGSAGNITQLEITSTTSNTNTFYIDDVQLQLATSSSTSATPSAYQEGTLDLRGVINNPVSLQNTANSTTAFQVQNAAGGDLVDVDTLDSTVSLGNSNNNSSTVNIQGGTGATAVNVQNGSGGTILVGTTAQNGTVTIGDISTANTGNTQTINLGNLNVAGTDNVNIGSTTNATAGTTTITGKTAVNITGYGASTWQTSGGSLQITGGTTLTLQSTSSSTVTLDSGGNGAVDIATGTTGKVIQIGAPNSAITDQIGIGDNTNGSAISTVSVGSESSSSSTTLQGGNGVGAIALTTGSGGTIALDANGGGNLTFTTNSSSSGSLFKSATANSTTAFQIQNTVGDTVFGVGTSATTGSGTNYITDSDMVVETATCSGTTGLTDWTVIGSPTDMCQNTSAADAYEGSTSMELVTTATVGEGASTTAFTSTPTYTTASNYEVSFYIMQTSGTALPASDLEVLSTVSSGTAPTCTGTIAGSSSTTLSASGFEEVSCTLTGFTASGNITGIKLEEVTTAEAATMYIDDVQLQSGTLPTGYDMGTISLKGIVSSPVTLQNGSNSTTAFQIQNASGKSLLTADTLNNALVLGQDGSPSNITVRGANAAGSNINGDNITFQASNGTGAGGSGSFIFQTGAASGSTIGEDNAEEGSTGSSSITLSYATGTETNMVMVVQTNSLCGNPLLSMTYNGISLTPLITSTNSPGSSCAHTEIWYIVNPSSGTHNVVANFTSTSGTIGVSTFYNVNTASPFGAIATASGTTTGLQATNLNVTATSTAQIVYDAISQDQDNCDLVGPASGQTELTSYNQCTGLFDSGSSFKAGASGTVSMGWDVSSADWIDVGFAINPVVNTSADTLSDSMVINDSGDVGIDNASPSYNLDVSGDERIQTPTNSSTAFELQNSSDSSSLVATTNTTIINDGMVSSAPIGTFNNGASWDSGNYVILDNGGPGVDGEVNYLLNDVGSDFTSTFSFWSESGGSDGTWFYAFDTQQPSSYHFGNPNGGYDFAYSDQNNDAEIYWDGTEIANSGTLSFTNSAWHTAKITKVGNLLTMYLDGVSVLSYTDTTRSLTGDFFGLGGCSCDAAGEHLAKSFVLSTDTVAMSSPIVQTNVLDASNSLGTLNVGGINATTIDVGGDNPLSNVVIGTTTETGTTTVNNKIIVGNSVSPTMGTEWDGHGTSDASLTIQPQNTGDLIILAVLIKSTSFTVKSLSGGGVSNWNYVTAYNSTTSGARTELWEGTATSTSSSAVSVTYSSTPGVTTELTAMDYSAGLGSNTNWTVTSSGTDDNTSSSTTITYPSLTASQSGELYWGYDYSATGTGGGGSTANFSYMSTGLDNEIAYDTDTATSTAYAPTAAQSISGHSTGVAALISASAGTGLTANDGITVGSGATGDIGPALLTLDNGTSSSDPATEINGSMYYNASMNSFRCGQNGRWVSCNGQVYSNYTGISNDVTNDTSDTYFVNSTSSANIGYTPPTNDCEPGVTYLINASGYYNQESSGTGFYLNLYEGGNELSEITVAGARLAENSTNGEWVYTATINCWSATAVSFSAEAYAYLTGTPTFTDGAAWAAGQAMSFGQSNVQTSNPSGNWTNNGSSVLALETHLGGSTTPKLYMTQFSVQRIGP